jgi:predicted ATPase/class 3 adenylate cyclase
MRDLPTGRVALLFSDIEGSTGLLEQLGDSYADLLLDHQRLLRDAFAGQSGTEVSTQGDSFFVVFPDAANAVRAAGEAQRAMDGFAWPDEVRVRVRMGIHIGHVVLAGDTYVGIDIHRAARIAAAANGGQVLLSDAARSVAEDRLPPDISLRDLGRHRLKDVGVEHLWQLAIDGLAAETRPLRSVEEHPSNLVVEPTPLIDREQERVDVAELLASAPLVTVTGPGGIGKSRIATAVARASLSDFPDGVFHLDLSAIGDAMTAASELGDLIGLHPAAATSPEDALLDGLRDRELLLVLDTADRVAGLADLLAAIASRCSRVRVLVTSRGPMHIAAEREYRVSPLALDASDPTDGPSPAAALFIERAVAVRPGLQIGPSDLAAVEAICERVDGLPLAIELAAARARVLSPTAILDRLERPLPLLAGGPADAPARQRALRDTIAWSYGLLDPGEQAALRRLAVLAGDFDLEAAEALAATDDPVATLETLVDRSLVSLVPTDSEPRFRMLRTIREFGLDALETSGETETTRDAHARHFLELARQAVEAVGGPDEPAALAHLEGDRAELRAALEWALTGASGDPTRAEVAIGLTGTLGQVWWLRGTEREGSAYLERAIALGPGTDRDAWAKALYWDGVLLDDLGRPDKARDRLESALLVRRELGDDRAIARILNSLGAVARSMGDLDRADTLLRESLSLKRVHDPRSVAPTLNNLAIVAGDHGRYQEAIELLQAALDEDDASGRPGARAFSQLNLGTMRVRAGDLDGGVRDLVDALLIIRERDLIGAVPEALEGLAEATLRRGDPARAARLVLTASHIRDREALSLSPIDRDRVEAIGLEVRAALDPAELESARADAASMDVRAAITYALAQGVPSMFPAR